MTWPTFDWLESSASDFWNSWNSWTGVFVFSFPMPVQFRMCGCACLWRYSCPRVLVCVSTPPCDVSCVCAGPFRAVPVLSLGSGSIENRKFFFSFSFGFFSFFFFFSSANDKKSCWYGCPRYWLLVTTSASRGKPIKSKDPPLNIKEKIFFSEKKGKKTFRSCRVEWVTV